jgi:hypothetical protein
MVDAHVFAVSFPALWRTHLFRYWENSTWSASFLQALGTLQLLNWKSKGSFSPVAQRDVFVFYPWHWNWKNTSCRQVQRWLSRATGSWVATAVQRVLVANFLFLWRRNEINEINRSCEVSTVAKNPRAWVCRTRTELRLSSEFWECRNSSTP